VRSERSFLLVIALLGATLILSTIAVAGLAMLGSPSPSILENLIVGSLTALAGLLVSTPRDEA
jgi:hypothetical protein